MGFDKYFKSFAQAIGRQAAVDAKKAQSGGNPIESTAWVNMFDTEKDITEIQGSFVYRKFEPFEQIDEGLKYTPWWAFDGFGDPLQAWETMEYIPRYVEFSWNSDSNGDLIPTQIPSSKHVPLGLIPVKVKDFIQGKNIFFFPDLLENYSVIISDELYELRRQQEKISDNSSVASKLDYLLGQVSSNKYTEGGRTVNGETMKGIEASINSEESVIPVLDPTTNRPIHKVEIQNKSQPPDIVVNSALIKHIVDASNKSPIVSNKFENSVSLGKQISAKYDPGVRKLSTYHTLLDSGDKTKYCFTAQKSKKAEKFEKDWQLIGYVISKYRVETTGFTYMYTRFVQRRDHYDPYVAYGQTYRYEIRPVYAKKANTSKKLIVTVSNESTFINIDCVEEKVPESPSEIKFEYILNNKIQVSWRKPDSWIEDRGKLWETNDIKGYQIFVRNDLREPYRLVKYFTFNNTMPAKYRIRAKEYIPDAFVVSTETDIPPSVDYWGAPKYYEANKYILEIRPNVDYYYTMCSIDAHGNSSNYGAQFKIRRDNVTGEVEVKLLCGKGAPKQYPNVFIPGKLVTSSMAVSSYQNMDIYYNPDTELSAPNEGKEAVSIQLFELETQVEKNIKITIDTNGS